MVYALIFLVLALLAIKGYCGKRISCFVECAGDSFLYNLVRMLICIFIGAAALALDGAFCLPDIGMLLITLLGGAASVAFLAGWVLAVQHNSLVSVDVGLTLGSIIPAVLCAILFGEAIAPLKMLGFAMIVCATAVLAGKGECKSEKRSAIGLILLLFTALGDGISSFAQQLYKQYYTEVGVKFVGVAYTKSVYHFYTYLFSALIFFLLIVSQRLFAARSVADGAEVKKIRDKLSSRVLVHIFVMAVCLFVANYLQTMATNDYAMPSQVLYPIIKGGCLVTVNLTAMLFFGERITARSVIGSSVAIIGIVCMSVL